MKLEDAIKELGKLCDKPQEMVWHSIATKGVDVLQRAFKVSQRTSDKRLENILILESRVIELEKQLGIYVEPVKKTFGITYNKSETGPRQE